MVTRQLQAYITGGNSADPAAFFKFQRNAEAVFALIGFFDSHDGGLASANWALRTLGTTIKGNRFSHEESFKQLVRVVYS